MLPARPAGALCKFGLYLSDQFPLRHISMKRSKRLKQSLADAEAHARRIALAHKREQWLAAQPGSVRRGFAAGKVEYPKELT